MLTADCVLYRTVLAAVTADASLSCHALIGQFLRLADRSLAHPLQSMGRNACSRTTTECITLNEDRGVCVCRKLV